MRSYIDSIRWAWVRDVWRDFHVSIMLLTLALVILTIAGCAKPGEKGVTPAEGVMFTCETYADTLDRLAELNSAGKIKKAHQDLVDGVVLTLGPICTGSAPDVDSKVKDVAIDNGVQILKTVLLISLSSGG